MLALLLATGFTWVTGLLDFDYDEGPVLGFAYSFPGPAAEWDVGPEASSVSIKPSKLTIQRVSDKPAYAIRSFQLPASAHESGVFLRISGRVDTLRRASPEKRENIAALMVWFLDGNRQPFNYLTVRALHGSEAHYSGSRIVAVPDNAEQVAVAMLTRESDGAFTLTDATVQQIARPMAATLVDLALAVIWASLVLLAGLWVVRHGSAKVSALLVGLVVLTFIGVLMPETARMSVLQPIYHKLAALLSVSSDQPLALSFKIGHFLVFFLVTVVLLMNRSALGLRTWLVLGCMLLLGIATEGLQLHLFDRTTRLSDLFIDMAGIGLALLLVLVVRWAQRRHRSSFRTSTRTLARMGLKPRRGTRARRTRDVDPTTRSADTLDTPSDSVSGAESGTVPSDAATTDDNRSTGDSARRGQA